MLFKIPDVENRLNDRYFQLIREHTGHAHSTAAGPKALPADSDNFASTQALWRFCKNRFLTPPRLAHPLFQAAQQSLADSCDQYTLVACDWSKLDYSTHTRKTDRICLGQVQERGYHLLSALLISDRGQPLAPLALELEAAAGVYSTRSETPLTPQSNLDQVLPVMNWAAQQSLPRTPVYVLDAEADSVFHYRSWSAASHLFLVRADPERLVQWEGQEQPLSQIWSTLQQRAAWRFERQVEYHGQKAQQYVAEVEVVLDRPAYQTRPDETGRVRQKRIAGIALRLRLILAEVRSAAGTVLAQWYLLTNVPATVSSATIALWYYWRWLVESFFKLLKAAGMHVEEWQQRSGLALFRRLLVASAACVWVWHLARSTAPEAEKVRFFLYRLSGRQKEHGQPIREEMLLAGLWVLLCLEDVLRQYDPAEIQAMLAFLQEGVGWFLKNARDG